MAKCPIYGKEVEMSIKKWDLGKTHRQDACLALRALWKKFRDYITKV